jgi:hypothetical protein
MDVLYKDIFISWMEKSEEVPFDIKGIDKNGKVEVDFNKEFLEFFIESIKGCDKFSIEDFVTKLIKLHS